MTACVTLSVAITRTDAQQTQPSTQPDTPHTQPDKPADIPHSGELLVRRMEQAHGQERWKDVDAVEADINVHFGGTHLIEGRMLYEPHRGRVRIDMKDDTTLIFDGHSAWVSPADSDFERTRFHLLTWSYFLAAPFKLSDSGANVSRSELRTIDRAMCGSVKVTFEPGTGDSPDDWYIAYANPKNDRLKAMAYIVTYGKSVTEAEKEPHVILYEDYEKVDGVWLSKSWRFRKWSERRGEYGKDIGHVTVEDIEFVESDDSDFNQPDNARKDPKPDT